jgi:integrase
MGRQTKKLSDTQIKRPLPPKLYLDDAGLYLKVTETGTKSWVYRYGAGGKHSMGLGAYPTISLKEARNKAEDFRRLRQNGIDPRQHRDSMKRQNEVDAAKAKTFQQCAEAHIEIKKAGWKNAKHAQQWANTLATYAYPVFGHLSIADIDTPLVLEVLNPIWETKTETATRVRGRIESVFSYAKSMGYFIGQNPAAWKDNLGAILAEPSTVTQVIHRPALSFTKMADFMAKLRSRPAFSARALEFQILTAARPDQARSATWDEISWDEKNGNVWTIPAERMKNRKGKGVEHRVPLSYAAMEVLDTMRQIQTDGYIFPGNRPNRPLSNGAILRLMERMGVGKSDAVPHGFRSTFRDWVSETTDHSPEAAEMALAHGIKNKVEASYRREDQLPKRVPLMNDWADYCNGIARSDNVVPLRVS